MRIKISDLFYSCAQKGTFYETSSDQTNKKGRKY